MTDFTLYPFPGINCPAEQSLTVIATRPSPTQLQLTYRLQGDTSGIIWPPRAAQPEPTENLWQHTCFEAFIGSADSDAYHEYNFSPSLNWNHYSFSGYRQRIDDAAKNAPQLTITRQADDIFELQAIITLPDAGDIIAGLTAVIEAADGTLTYWALAHPAAQPDFHHKDGFIAAP